MRKVAVLVLVGLFFTGCKTSFKSSFRDFNAYYNTFYNAKKSYNAGLEKSESQQREYNPLQPIRIYQTPLGAGATDFQNAIDKGADILRKYDGTKWVDDALEIIGKSYFFRREYFSAEQKFEELYLTTEETELKQRAVFWKGRVLLELEAHNRGVQYLTDELSNIEGNWKRRLDHQIQVVLAEHYVEREDFVNAIDLLVASVPELPRKEEKERGYFLIGQLYEYLGDPEGAFNAYDRVEDFYTDYDIQYEALKKKAEVARVLGRTEEAYKVFSKMARDDKNTEFISQLNYELARTEEERGNYRRAEKIYIDILRDPIIRPEPITRALVYNGLAELYRFHFNNYSQAAAYYDSSASVNVSAELLPEEYQASENAQSFGEYAGLKEELALKDSLLWLGNLPQAEFDSVLKVLEQQKREELARLQREQEQRRNTLVNVNNQGGSQTQDQNSAENGFLNYKNPVLLAEASQQFRAYWDNRPLVDNWRLSSLLVANTEQENSTETDGIANESHNSTEVFINIDLSNIPFTESDQDSMKNEIASLNYQLANLFFLSLNLPDSAEIYFNKVLEERPESSVAPVTLYSLSELYSIQNEGQKALEKAQQLVEKYPGTVYAERVINDYNLAVPDSVNQEVISPREKYLAITEDELMPDSVRIKALKQFEVDNRPGALAGKAQFNVVQSYMKLGKQQEGFTADFNEWREQHQLWERELQNFEVLKDSSQQALSDTTLNESEREFFESISDSTLTKPDLSEYFPYQGQYWDSTRSAIDLYLVHYSDLPEAGQVQRLNTEFGLPAEDEVQRPDQTEESLVEYSEYLSCSDLNEELFVRGGMDGFMRNIQLPGDLRQQSIAFLFFVNERGIIDEFKLSSQAQNQELIDTFVEAIDQNLTFEPILVEGQAAKVQCEVTFPLNN